MTFRVGQLSIDALRRSIQLATAATHSILRNSPQVSTTPPGTQLSPFPNSPPADAQCASDLIPAQQDPQSPESQQKALVGQADQQQPYMIRNLCPVDLVVGQAGTQEVVQLPAHAEVGYHWHTPPGFTPSAERALHLAYAAVQRAVYASPEAEFCDPHDVPTSLSDPSRQPPSPQSPLQDRPEHAQAAASASSPALSHTNSEPGNSRRLLDRQPGGDPSKLAWGGSFDCTATGSHQQQLLLHDGTRWRIAVSTHNVGLQWQICLQPEYMICNKLATVAHLHHTGQLAGSAEATDGAMLTLDPERKVGLENSSQPLMHAECIHAPVGMQNQMLPTVGIGSHCQLAWVQ